MRPPGRKGQAPLSVGIWDAATPADFSKALKKSGLWDIFADKGDKPLKTLLLVDFGGFSAGDPTRLDAQAVETFIDLLLANGADTVSIGATTDSSSLWAGNRDVYALAELAGYRYETDAGHPYAIVDLAEDTREDVFPAGSALAGTPASAAWLDADVRICLSALRTDQQEGYAGALHSLLGALPLADKSLHYRHRRTPGDCIAALLAIAPPHFTLIDARTIAMGTDGRRDGKPFPANLLIASRSPLLADIAAGLKLGLDPLASPLVAAVSSAHPPPPAHHFDGSISALENAETASPWARHLAQAREANPMVSGLLEPWLQPLDAAQFPHTRPLDARANAMLASLLRPGATGEGLRLAVDTIAALAADLVQGWQVLFAKDSLVRRSVPLGIDPGSIPASAWDDMVAELESLWPVAVQAADFGDGLRWRRLGGAVVFAIARDLAIPFDHFVGQVNVAHAIQHMNDYLGGVIVPVESDAQGRPVRQAERNLYLPQPNYLVLAGGLPIDVSKIEAVRYEADMHSLYWKTLHSENGSAEADDGIARFIRTAGGTRIEIIGKQRFTLPPFWKLFDVAMLPALETALTTNAYRVFFNRTLANFEALAEGRNVAIGNDRASAPASARLEATAARLLEGADPILARFRANPDSKPARVADAQGFVHSTP